MTDAEQSYALTPAALLRNRGLAYEDAFVARAREFMSPERRQLRADYEARMDEADPTWRASRALQEQLATRGWPGTWVDIDGPLIHPALQPLYAAAAVAQSRQGTESPAGDDPVMGEFKAEVQGRLNDARRRLAEMNAGLPPGLGGM